jgi:hypothetical protein
VVRESFFVLAQLLNAPIQINRIAVLKVSEFVEATCSVICLVLKGYKHAAES